MTVRSILLLLTLPLTVSANGSWCESTPIDLEIDFEVDASGEPFSVGDTPSRLPGGIKVRGFRRGDVRTENHLAIFDAASPTGGDNDLLSPVDKHVLVINEKNDKSAPDDNPKGGSIIFRFKNPVRVDEIRFLDLDDERRRPARIVGRIRSSGEKLVETVPRPWNRISLQGWVDVDRLRVNLFESAAIASLKLAVCEESSEPKSMYIFSMQWHLTQCLFLHSYVLFPYYSCLTLSTKTNLLLFLTRLPARKGSFQKTRIALCNTNLGPIWAND